MNRLIALIPTLLLTAVVAMAQPGKTKQDSLSAASVGYLPDTIIENKLIELAMKSPFYTASIHQINITELQLKSTKNAWLNLLSLSTTVNDQTLKKPEPGANTYVYPKYNVGITIPLGIIFSQGNNVKSARESLALTKDNQEQLARTIKATILSKYREWRNYERMLYIQSELVTSVVAAANQADDEWNKGTIAKDVYLTVMKTKNDELARSINLKYSQYQVQLEIEKIIGVPLESVLYPAPATK